MAALADEFNSHQRLTELESINRKLQRQLSESKRKNADFIQAVYQAAHDAQIVVGTPSPIPGPKADKRPKPETMVLHLTDWQLGKVTHGPEAYDPDVCADRVRDCVRRAIKVTEIQRAAHPVPECWLLLGGDLVEGTNIFPGQAWEIAPGGVLSQIFVAANLVEESIMTLLEHFEKVNVTWVAGNHGRMGRAKSGDHPRSDNTDAILVGIVRDKLRKQKRLNWVEPEGGWYSMVRIGNYTALLCHGDQIKSFGGNVPAFGILRKVNAWATGVLPEFRDCWMGHFHQAMTLSMANGGRVFVTPSTESGSQYATEFVGAKGRPGQRAAFVSPEKGEITAEYLLWLLK